MVHLTLDRPYTVHARSTDRSGSALTTPSQYKLVLRDPITCNDDKYMVATLISAKVPSTFYQIDGKNNTFTVGFNRTRFSMFAQYADIPLQDADAGKTERADYLVEVTVKIQKGNYNIEELLAEIKTKLNDACTESAETEDFRTFLRSDDTTSSLYVEDHAGMEEETTQHTQKTMFTPHRSLTGVITSNSTRSNCFARTLGARWRWASSTLQPLGSN